MSFSVSVLMKSCTDSEIGCTLWVGAVGVGWGGSGRRGEVGGIEAVS